MAVTLENIEVLFKEARNDMHNDLKKFKDDITEICLGGVKQEESKFMDPLTTKPKNNEVNVKQVIKKDIDVPLKVSEDTTINNKNMPG